MFRRGYISEIYTQNIPNLFTRSHASEEKITLAEIASVNGPCQYEASLLFALPIHWHAGTDRSRLIAE
jgi:hypothetical protein